MSETAPAYVVDPRYAAVSEKAWTAQVVRAARQLGYLTYHTWRSLHSEPGFPDIIMVRDGRLIAAELKREKGKLSDAQERWLEAFRACGIPAFVWRPHQMDEVLAALAGVESRGG